MRTRNHLYSLRPAVLGFILGTLASAKTRQYYGTFKASIGPQRNLERPTRLRHLLPLRHAERLVADRASFRSWFSKWAALFARPPAQNHNGISPPALVRPLPEEEAREGPFDTNGDTSFYDPQHSILLEQESPEFPDTVTDLVQPEREAGLSTPSPILEDLSGPGSFTSEDADGDINEAKQAPRPSQRELAPDNADGPTISCVKYISTNLWSAMVTLSGNNHKLAELLGRLQTIMQESIDDNKPIHLVIKLVAGEEIELAQRLVIMHHILNYTGSRIHDLVLEVPNFAHPNVSNPRSIPSILPANMNFPMLETLSWFGRIQDDLISQSFRFGNLTTLSLHCAIAVDDCGELLFICRHQLQKFT
ncbi:hypothetical protein Hypma_013701 [Hypsizygus marmoreus]|uniref:Uncharacterized protein n=1 Tax=Hypsizygus marmoreus TaxID=39966 RepID=A0A369JF79_HYPMA|nr:hypothetical protein Hypma_013701 [Hypsizygus marmoreus]